MAPAHGPRDRPKPKTAEEFAAVQRHLKEEAAERRKRAAATRGPVSRTRAIRPVRGRRTP